MTKDELYKCYTSYINKYPEIQRIKNTTFLRNACISKDYLDENEVENWSDLPKELSSGQIVNLNKTHDEHLKWKLLESSLTSKQLDNFETRHQIKLPQSFCEFLMGYTPLFDTIMTQVVASEDYDSYSYDPANDTFEYLFEDGDDGTVKIANILFKFVPVFHGQELSFWEEWEPFYQMFFPFGLIYIGDYYCAGEEKLFLDCKNGEVLSIHHDEIPVEDLSEETLQQVMHFRFKNFDHFLRCMLTVELYDAEQEDLERVEEYKKKPPVISNETNVIAL